jgi:hypothetical protein
MSDRPKRLKEMTPRHFNQASCLRTCSPGPQQRDDVHLSQGQDIITIPQASCMASPGEVQLPYQGMNVVIKSTSI